MNTWSIVDDEHLAKRIADPEWAKLIFMKVRPGALAFMGSVEYLLYPPATPANAKFEIIIKRWMGVEWDIVFVPASDITNVQKMASDIGMRLTLGVPTVTATPDEAYEDARIIQDGPLKGMMEATFPAKGPQVWTVENNRDHALRKSCRDSQSVIRRREIEMIDCFEQGDRPTPERIASFIWGKGPLK